MPYLGKLIEVLQHHHYLDISAETKHRLLTVSPATVDRILARKRKKDRNRGLSTTRSGHLLKRNIPVRIFSDWNETRPGFVEADLVAHCGTWMAGSYVHSLVMTDIATGWTEPLAIPYRDQQMALMAIRAVQHRLPFELKGLDTDNGTEFLNHSLLDYCHQQKISFTRSRAYKKNDQCHVEQKNCQVVRKFVGYDRFEGMESCRRFSELYKLIRLYVNFFQPSMKLISKQRDGSKVIKTHDKAQTPYQRLISNDEVTSQVKSQLKRQYLTLDPVKLMVQIYEKQDRLWEMAWVDRHTKPEMAVNSSSGDRVGGNDDTTVRESSRSCQHQNGGYKTLVDVYNTDRMYRSSKRTGRYHLVKHDWVTRPDPFEDVKEDIRRELHHEPHLEAKTLLFRLQQNYPGRYKYNQLRTLQRRVKKIRLEQIREMTEEIGIILEPEPS